MAKIVVNDSREKLEGKLRKTSLFKHGENVIKYS